MIRLHRHDGTRLVEHTYTGPEDLDAPGWCWIDATDEVDRTAVSSMLGFDPEELGDVTGEAFPKADRFGDHRHIVLHAMVFDGGRIDTVAFHTIVRDDLVVTFHHVPIFGIEWSTEHLSGSHVLEVRSPLELVGRIAVAGSRRFITLIEALEGQLDDLEVRAMDADVSVIGEAQALRRDTITLRRVFGPQRDVLAALAADASMDGGAARAFREADGHTFRFVESLDAMRSLLASIQDTHRGAIAERTNEVMKVLTVFSATMLPLTLVTGIWGMNVASLPGEGTPDAFWWLVGAMGGIVVGLWVYFAWRGFVGGPRLGRLPRAVGITLAHLGTAPIRAVSRPVARIGGRIVGNRDENGPDTKEDVD